MTAFKLAAGVAASVLLAACASTTTGKGTFAGGSSSSAAPSASASGFPSSAAPTDSASAGTTSCTSQMYCDGFSDKTSGWPVENKPHYFAQYDNYQGGTYRIGERTDKTVSEDAPFDITKISHDYSVQIDVDATLGQKMPSSAGYGISCWEHTAKDGQSGSAFIFLITGSEASLGLWDDTDGTYHSIATKSVSGVVKSSGTNHLTAQCIQGTTGSSAQAQLSLSINGSPAVSGTYDKSTRTYSWAVGKSVGLLASGVGSDIFYDNFRIISKCSGSTC